MKQPNIKIQFNSLNIFYFIDRSNFHGGASFNNVYKCHLKKITFLKSGSLTKYFPGLNYDFIGIKVSQKFKGGQGTGNHAFQLPHLPWVVETRLSFYDGEEWTIEVGSVYSIITVKISIVYWLNWTLL